MISSFKEFFINTAFLCTENAQENKSFSECRMLKIVGTCSTIAFIVSLALDLFILMTFIIKSEMISHKNLSIVALVAFNMMGCFGDLLLASLSNLKCK